MSMKKCPDCGGLVNTTASACPHCGKQMNAGRSCLGCLFGCLAFLILIAVLLAVLVSTVDWDDAIHQIRDTVTERAMEYQQEHLGEPQPPGKQPANP